MGDVSLDREGRFGSLCRTLRRGRFRTFDPPRSTGALGSSAVGHLRTSRMLYNQPMFVLGTCALCAPCREPKSLSVGKEENVMISRVATLSAVFWMLVPAITEAVRCELNGVVYESQWHPDCKPIAPGKVPTSETANKVVCNQFDVIAEVDGRQVSFRLVTDLPDDTEIMARISRSYWAEGSLETYLGAYSQRKTTVRELKQSVRILVDDTKWKNELIRKQEMLASLGEPLQVKRISEEIELDLTVPINQDNPAFGKRNKNLDGPFVSKEGLRTISVTKRFNIPFGKEKEGTIVGKRQYNLDPYNLEVNLRYRISKKTPISQELKPKDPLKAIAEMQYLPAGSVIRILKKESRRSAPHYYVTAEVRGSTRHKIIGWIYSPALMGQDLNVVE